MAGRCSREWLLLGAVANRYLRGGVPEQKLAKELGKKACRRS